MKISTQHFLTGENIAQLNCEKNTVKFLPNLPDTLIIHYTGGRDGVSSAQYLCKKGIQASAHVVIDRSGKIFQLVPFNTQSWHAGKSSYGGRDGLNKYSIGIELDNAGLLVKVKNGYQSAFKGYYTENDVIKAAHRNQKDKKKEQYWHLYAEEQMKRCYELCENLIANYGITTILGHEEIAPDRKIDPGPAFPLDDFRNKLLKK